MVDLPRAQRVSQGYLNGEVQSENAFGQVGVVSHIRMKLRGQEARQPRYLLRPVIQE